MLYVAQAIRRGLTRPQPVLGVGKDHANVAYVTTVVVTLGGTALLTLSGSSLGWVRVGTVANPHYVFSATL